jgi:hypothetical protein
MKSTSEAQQHFLVWKTNGFSLPNAGSGAQGVPVLILHGANQCATILFNEFDAPNRSDLRARERHLLKGVRCSFFDLGRHQDV